MLFRSRALSGAGIPVITIEEEQTACGFGAEVARICAEEGLRVPLGVFGIGDTFVAHGDTELLQRDAGLLPEQLARRIQALLRGGSAWRINSGRTWPW